MDKLLNMCQLIRRHRASALCGLVILLLSACGSAPKIVKYKPNTANQLLPKHANTNAEIRATQLAYLDRGLVLDKLNRLMPAQASDCQVDIYSSNTSERSNNLNSAMYKGVALTVSYKNGQLAVKELPSLSSVATPSFILWNEYLQSLNKTKALVIDLSEMSRRNEVFKAYQYVSSTLPKQQLTFKADSKYLSELRQLARKNVTVLPVLAKGSASSKPYAINALSTLGQVNAIHYSKSSFRSDARINAVAIETSGSLLDACRTFSDFIAPPTVHLSAKNNINTVTLIKGLPVDANFTDLPLQQSLVAKGNYKTITGDVIKLSSSRSNQARGTKDVCAGMSKSHEDYAFCQGPREDGGKLKSKTGTVVIGSRKDK